MGAVDESLEVDISETWCLFENLDCDSGVNLELVPPRFENVRNVCNVGKVRIGEHQRWLEERFTAAMEGGPHPYHRFINFE